ATGRNSDVTPRPCRCCVPCTGDGAASLGLRFGGMATVAELGRRRPPRDRGELETKVRQLVAAGLMEEPAEGPCYVKNPDDERMPAGWFMRPDSSTTPIF